MLFEMKSYSFKIMDNIIINVIKKSLTIGQLLDLFLVCFVASSFTRLVW